MLRLVYGSCHLVFSHVTPSQSRTCFVLLLVLVQAVDIGCFSSCFKIATHSHLKVPDLPVYGKWAPTAKTRKETQTEMEHCESRTWGGQWAYPIIQYACCGIEPIVSCCSWDLGSAKFRVSHTLKHLASRTSFIFLQNLSSGFCCSGSECIREFSMRAVKGI